MRIDPASTVPGDARRTRRRERRPVRELIAASSPTRINLLDCSDARFWYPWHFHPEVEIKLVLVGSGTRYVGDSIAPFEPGDLCIVGSGTPHAWSSQPVRGKWVRARVVQFLPEILGSLPDLASVAALLERAKLGIALVGRARAAVASELDRLFVASSPAARFGHLLTTLALAADANDAQVLGKALPSAQQQPGSLAWRVLDYLSEHATEAQAEAAVAHRFGLSPAGFSRFFAREFGKPFVRYLAELRVGNASHLLIERELTVAEIAAQAGFGTVASLNRHFRAVKGTTPTAYRRLARAMHHG